MALAASQDEFIKLNTSLLVISTDGLNSHIEWVKSMESISLNGVAPVKIGFPIITDADLKISKAYGMLHIDYSPTRDIRGVFFIDPENKIRAFFNYPSSVGRNMEEILRTLKALQNNDKYNVLAPANWKPGDDVLIKSPATIKDSDKLKEKNDPDLRQITWYMWYKKL
jgi:peroxiredoxin (alkyl hydroperoxide reductase subunit C)